MLREKRKLRTLNNDEDVWAWRAECDPADSASTRRLQSSVMPSPSAQYHIRQKLRHRSQGEAVLIQKHEATRLSIQTPLMHPPVPVPSTISVHDEIATTISSSLFTSNTTMTPASLVLSIATAAATQLTTSALTAPSSQPTNATGHQGQEENTGECKLLGPFAILVQGALGALALLSLVFKRWREKPQRPLKVWSFDVSKQVVGSILLHLLNLLMSMFSSGQIGETIVNAAATTLAAGKDVYTPNPCSFYLLNLAIDTTVGIPILIFLLKILTIGASYTPLARPPESIESGHYGTPPNAWWWMKQCLIYFIGLIGMKICVFILFQLCPWLGRVGDWALRWTEGNEAVQIAFVMFIFPLIMNAIQYYIVDTFIKKRSPQLGDEEPPDHDTSEERGALLGEDDPRRATSTEEDEAQKADDLTSRSPKRSAQLERVVSYDPDKDGEEVDARHRGNTNSLIAHAEEEGVQNRPTE
jgi:hypothetical protein